MKTRLMIVAAATLLLAGCAPLIIGAAGAGAGVAYLRGALNATFAATVPQVAEATDVALNRMGMTEISVSADSTGGQATAKSATGDSIKIDMEAAGTNTTEISIRIGTFGDEEKSTMIYNEIRDTLIRRGYIEP